MAGRARHQDDRAGGGQGRADRARDVGLFRYALIREAADRLCRPGIGAGWSGSSRNRSTPARSVNASRSPGSPLTAGS